MAARIGGGSSSIDENGVKGTFKVYALDTFDIDIRRFRYPVAVLVNETDSTEVDWRSKCLRQLA